MGISITNLNDIFEATKPSVIEYFQYLIPQEKDLSTWSTRGVRTSLALLPFMQQVLQKWLLGKMPSIQTFHFVLGRVFN